MQDLKHLVLIRNDVSGTECIEEGKIHLVELQEKAIILHVPANICIEGHGLTLCMVKLPITKSISRFPRAGMFKDAFEVIGKVLQVERPEHRNERLKQPWRDEWDKDHWTITVTFTQYDVRLWEAFIVSYVERQEKINELKPKYE